MWRTDLARAPRDREFLAKTIPPEWWLVDNLIFRGDPIPDDWITEEIVHYAGEEADGTPIFKNRKGNESNIYQFYTETTTDECEQGEENDDIEKNGEKNQMKKRINSRSKGKGFELTLAHMFQADGWPHARRSAQYAGGTGESADVIGGPERLHVEAKAQEKIKIYDWMEQAQRDAAEAEQNGATHRIPAVFFKRNRKPVLVCMAYADFIALYKEATGEGNATNPENPEDPEEVLL